MRETRRTAQLRRPVKQVRDYINSWNENAKPFTWTATTDGILAKVRLVQTSMKKIVNNNSR
ncbi:hypothetical protein ABT124_28160 [Streptomyces sp. NPDC001982]|uniref:hypothetical protein n=1 Tax=Streptomyces sp. NPDC001982 TaxID=3154405 RepID=UPI003329C41E